MKRKSDPRHQARRRIIQKLFASSFNQKQPLKNELAKKIATKTREIDKVIAEAAPLWPLDQIAPVDLVILRLAVFELIYSRDIPFKVTIDEAVELAKEFGSESSPAFVNGVLGKIYQEKMAKTPGLEAKV